LIKEKLKAEIDWSYIPLIGNLMSSPRGSVLFEVLLASAEGLSDPTVPLPKPAGPQETQQKIFNFH
jgi:hypothetical protein